MSPAPERQPTPLGDAVAGQPAAAAASRDRGILLVRGPQDRVQAWARKGLVTAHVVPLDGWTAVCPVPGPAVAPAGAERERALELFAGRPVPSRLRPAVGLYLLGGRAVVTAHPSGRRATPQWLVWQPGDALVTARPLPAGRLDALALVAGLPAGAGSDRVARVLLEPSGSPTDALVDLLTVLELPGQALLDGSVAPVDAAGAVEVHPSPGAIERFRSVAREDAHERAELEAR